MVRLVKNGVDLPERILHVNKRVLHPGIAVANVLKILAENNPAICRKDWGDKVVQTGKVDAKFTKITIAGVDYPLRQQFTPKRDTGIERCLCIQQRPGYKYEEAFFILNPHPANKTLDRLVVKCEWDRRNLSTHLAAINRYCLQSKLPCLQGIQIL